MTPDDARALLARCLAEVAPDADLASLDPAADLRDALALGPTEMRSLAARIAQESAVEIPDRDVGRLTTSEAVVAYLCAAPRLGATIVADHVTKSYGSLVRAVDDVTLRVQAGQFALLTGPSGSGKSTLLNLIAGFDVPDAGAITVDGHPVTDTTDMARFRREVLGFIFQSHHLVSGLSALDNVDVALLPTGRRRTERVAMAQASLAEVGMAARASHLPSQLSGGERQRVAVARALANRPRLLLADEPTGQLDTASGVEILELFRALRDRHGMTILLVSHDDEARRFADVTFHMRDGRLVDESVSPAPRPDAGE